MRKLWWLLAALLSIAIILHFMNDRSLIKKCVASGQYYDLYSHSCSIDKTNKRSSQSFLDSHLILISLWIFSLLAMLASLVVRLTTKTQSVSKKKLLMIDNYDSFTYNLVQYFLELGVEVIVKRNDDISITEIKKLEPNYIVISPGPCTPNESGISLTVVEQLAGKYPILGVCLGHQVIAQIYGAKIIKAKKLMHGKTSRIHHNQEGIFKSLNNPFNATRYHSLAVDPDTLSSEFRVTAWTENTKGELECIMGIKHKSLQIEGIQFHPESILSDHGHQLLKNFLNQ